MTVSFFVAQARRLTRSPYLRCLQLGASNAATIEILNAFGTATARLGRRRVEAVAASWSADCFARHTRIYASKESNRLLTLWSWQYLAGACCILSLKRWSSSLSSVMPVTSHTIPAFKARTVIAHVHTGNAVIDYLFWDALHLFSTLQGKFCPDLNRNDRFTIKNCHWFSEHSLRIVRSFQVDFVWYCTGATKTRPSNAQNFQ